MSTLALNRPDLLARCVAGDARAWEELLATYRAQTLTFLRRLGVNGRDAEDACQEVFVQVFRYLHGFEHRSDFRTWLYKLCISQAARVRRRATLAKALCALGLGVPSEPPAWTEADACDLVDRALGRLKPRQREVFVLYELEGVATAEIARLLGTPAATVRRQLQEARASFEAFVREPPLRGGR